MNNGFGQYSGPEVKRVGRFSTASQRLEGLLVEAIEVATAAEQCASLLVGPEPQTPAPVAEAHTGGGCWLNATEDQIERIGAALVRARRALTRIAEEA